MRLAIIKRETNIVENIIIPPKGADAYFVPDGYLGELCDDNVGIGYLYNSQTKVFTVPAVDDQQEGV